MKQSESAKAESEDQKLLFNSTITASTGEEIEVIVQIEDRLGNKNESKTKSSTE